MAQIYDFSHLVGPGCPEHAPFTEFRPFTISSEAVVAGYDPTVLAAYGGLVKELAPLLEGAPPPPAAGRLGAALDGLAASDPLAAGPAVAACLRALKRARAYLDEDFVVAIFSGYGEGLAYRPGWRPYCAICPEPATLLQRQKVCKNWRCKYAAARLCAPCKRYRNDTRGANYQRCTDLAACEACEALAAAAARAGAPRCAHSATMNCKCTRAVSDPCGDCQAVLDSLPGAPVCKGARGCRCACGNNGTPADRCACHGLPREVHGVPITEKCAHHDREDKQRTPAHPPGTCCAKTCFNSCVEMAFWYAAERRVIKGRFFTTNGRLQFMGTTDPAGEDVDRLAEVWVALLKRRWPDAPLGLAGPSGTTMCDIKTQLDVPEELHKQLVIDYELLTQVLNWHVTRAPDFPFFVMDVRRPHGDQRSCNLSITLCTDFRRAPGAPPPPEWDSRLQDAAVKVREEIDQAEAEEPAAAAAGKKKKKKLPTQSFDTCVVGIFATRLKLLGAPTPQAGFDVLAALARLFRELQTSTIEFDGEQYETGIVLYKLE